MVIFWYSKINNSFLPISCQSPHSKEGFFGWTLLRGVAGLLEFPNPSGHWSFQCWFWELIIRYRYCNYVWSSNFRSLGNCSGLKGNLRKLIGFMMLWIFKMLFEWKHGYCQKLFSLESAVTFQNFSWLSLINIYIYIEIWKYLANCGWADKCTYLI